MKCSVSRMETLVVLNIFGAKIHKNFVSAKFFCNFAHKNNENGKSNTVFRRSKPHQTIWS